MSENAEYFIVSGDTPGKFKPIMAVKSVGDTFNFGSPIADATVFKGIDVHKFPLNDSDN